MSSVTAEEGAVEWVEYERLSGLQTVDDFDGFGFAFIEALIAGIEFIFVMEDTSHDLSVEEQTLVWDRIKELTS